MEIFFQERFYKKLEIENNLNNLNHINNNLILEINLFSLLLFGLKNKLLLLKLNNDFEILSNEINLQFNEQYSINNLYHIRRRNKIYIYIFISNFNFLHDNIKNSSINLSTYSLINSSNSSNTSHINNLNSGSNNSQNNDSNNNSNIINYLLVYELTKNCELIQLQEMKISFNPLDITTIQYKNNYYLILLGNNLKFYIYEVENNGKIVRKNKRNSKEKKELKLKLLNLKSKIPLRIVMEDWNNNNEGIQFLVGFLDGYLQWKRFIEIESDSNNEEDEKEGKEKEIKVEEVNKKKEKEDNIKISTTLIEENLKQPTFDEITPVSLLTSISPNVHILKTAFDMTPIEEGDEEEEEEGEDTVSIDSTELFPHLSASSSSSSHHQSKQIYHSPYHKNIKST